MRQPPKLDWLRLLVVGAANGVATYFWIVATAQERVDLKVAAALVGCFIVMTPRTIPFGRYSGFRSQGHAAETLRRLPPDEDNQELSWVGYAAFVISVLAAGAYCLVVYPNSLVSVARGVSAIILISVLLLAIRGWVHYRMRGVGSQRERDDA